MKILLIGGYPKGYDIPFHPDTLSGKRLRSMVSELGLNAEYLDLWRNLEEERHGYISAEVRLKIVEAIENGVTCIALGKWVKNCLWWKAAISEAIYLPHPAARRKADREKLREGLQSVLRIKMQNGC